MLTKCFKLDNNYKPIDSRGSVKPKQYKHMHMYTHTRMDIIIILLKIRMKRNFFKVFREKIHIRETKIRYTIDSSSNTM